MTMNKLEKKNSKIEKLIVTDSLTGLYNRSYLFRHIEKEIQRSIRYHRPFSLLILDVDKFKGYNDVYGHLEGDLFLKVLGKIIRRSIRNTDVACRFGGDEFIVVLPETDHMDARVIAERMRERIKTYPFYPKNEKEERNLPVNKTISIGISTINHNKDTLEKLIERADKSMYEAKQGEGDKTVISRSPNPGEVIPKAVCRE